MIYPLLPELLQVAVRALGSSSLPWLSSRMFRGLSYGASALGMSWHRRLRQTLLAMWCVTPFARDGGPFAFIAIVLKRTMPGPVISHPPMGD